MRLLILYYITCEHTVIHKHAHPYTHAHTHTQAHTHPYRDAHRHLATLKTSCIFGSMYMTRPTHMCDMTYSYVWHDVFICVTWRIHMCDMTYSYVWHDYFLCVASSDAHSLRHILRFHTSNRCCWNQPEIARVMSLREVHNCMSKSLGLIILCCIRISKRFWFHRNEARIGDGMVAFVAHLKSTHKCMGFVTHFKLMGHVTRMYGVCLCACLCVFVSAFLCTRICVCACVACICVCKQHCLSWTISG